MLSEMPHYLLFSETGGEENPGRWRFVLRAPGGLEQSEAADTEPDVQGERLELLTVVRALESLDQPSCVTLMTPGGYVRHGVRYGLPEWRCNGWKWEYFGEMVPVKHADLWQRLDQVMQYHQVGFCRWRLDRPHGPLGEPASSARHAHDGDGPREVAAAAVRARGQAQLSGGEQAAQQHRVAASDEGRSAAPSKVARTGRRSMSRLDSAGVSDNDKSAAPAADSTSAIPVGDEKDCPWSATEYCLL